MEASESAGEIEGAGKEASVTGAAKEAEGKNGEVKWKESRRRPCPRRKSGSIQNGMGSGALWQTHAGGIFHDFNKD